MLNSRIYNWTKWNCSRKVFYLQNPEIGGFKECSFNLLRNDYSSCLVRHIHYSPEMKNIYKFILKRKDLDTANGAMSHTHLKQLLQKCDSVASQIEVFNSEVKLSEEDISNRHTACQELENIFKSCFPVSFLCLLGSSVTGFGLKGCDVDLSFQLQQNEYNQNSSVHATVLSNDIEAGKIPTSMFPVLPPKQQLRFLRKVLRDSGLGGASPTIIPGHHPILNFAFRNLNCDLSVNNKSAFSSTNLMLLCGKLDERIAPLFQILTYWAKHSKFIGGPLKFKSYSLFLLMVYFLQTRSPPILPPVQKIFDKSEFLKNQENWSYNVSMYLGNFDASQNNQSIEELLQEFFFFYSNFDFSTVISPMISGLIDRDIFHNQDESKFELNSISIQDPLNLDWNVTTGVTWKNCKLFVKGLLSANVTYQEKGYDEVLAKEWDLLCLFDYYQTFNIFSKRKNVTIEVPLPLTTNRQPEITKLHLKNSAENILKIFEFCLNFQCKLINTSTCEQTVNSDQTSEHLETEKSSHMWKIENNVQEHSSPFLIFRFMCNTSDTWFGRSNFHPQSLNESITNFLETERCLSLKLYKDREMEDKESKDKVDNDFQFICECLGVLEKDDVKLLVNLEAVNSDVFIPKLAMFLKYYIPKCMVKINCKT